MIYKTLSTHETGRLPVRGDTVLIHYTGWRQSTGATFFTTRGGTQAIRIDLNSAAPEFGEALRLLRVGEKMIAWVPASQEARETLVYEFELVDVITPSVVKQSTPRQTAVR